VTVRNENCSERSKKSTGLVKFERTFTNDTKHIETADGKDGVRNHMKTFEIFVDFVLKNCNSSFSVLINGLSER
jgi:hypothetical protein